MSGNSSPDWSLLVDTGRAKAIGVAWDNDELHAIHELKIPVDYVRDGCLTVEAYEKKKGEVEGAEEKPLIYWTKDQLVAEVQKLGIDLSSAPSRPELMHMIKLERDKLNNLETPKEEEVEEEIEEPLTNGESELPGGEEADQERV